MEYLLEAGPFEARDGEGRPLFADIELRLEEGWATVLSGPSGSGKSSLLRLVTGLSAGALEAARRLRGERFRGPGLPAWRARVTLMAQDAPMIQGSVRDNLELPFQQRAAGGRLADRDRAQMLLEAVGLEHLPAERHVATLSGGERHRLALARGLLWDPPVLLADEPLAGLDEGTAAACLGLLLDFAHRPGHALLLVLHDVGRAGLADAVVRLADGRLEPA